MKRSLLLATLFFLTLATLGWGHFLHQATIESSPSHSCGTRPIRVQFWTLQLRQFPEYFNRLIAEYEQAHPRVCIEWTDIPFSEGEKRVLTSVLSPRPPDVVNLNPAFAATLAEKSALVDLNASNARKERPRYLQATLDASRHWDGRWFGLPWYVTSPVLFYNQAVLKRADLKQPPSHPQQWQQAAQTLHRHPGFYLAMPVLTEGGGFFKDLLAHGVKLYDQQARAIFAHDPRAVQRLAFWVQAYQQGWIPADSLTETHRAALERYQSGMLGLLPAGVSLLPQIQANAPDVYQKTGVVPQVQLQGGVDLSLMVLSVPARSPHPAEAVDFALFVTDTRQQRAFSQLAPVLPSTYQGIEALIQSTATASTDLLQQAQRISARQLKQARYGLPVMPNQARRNEILDQAVQATLLGRLTPEQALKQAQEQINSPD